MAGHAGMAHGGQPMVQDHHSNQGVPGGPHPGASMGQQMHPGLAGPGGPQVSQGGPMMGMMQGGGPPGGASGPAPSAHALQHLNPQPHHQQMFAGQQMPMPQASKSHTSSLISEIRASYWHARSQSALYSRCSNICVGCVIPSDCSSTFSHSRHGI